MQTAGPLPALVFPPERILLVASDDDPVITPAVRQSMRTRHQGARKTLIAGGGHYPYLAQPELYNGAVGLFLEM